MCGQDYCETCEPDAFMIAWTEGKHHTTPKFGDGAQEMVASRKRLETYRDVMQTDRTKAMEFPEFLWYSNGGVVWRFAQAVSKSFTTLVARVPSFAGYVAEHPRPVSAYESGKAGRKRRKRANKAWRPHCIADFVQRKGGISALREMYAVVGDIAPPPPDWLFPQTKMQVTA